MLNGVKALVFDLDGTLYVSSGLGDAINRCACAYIAELSGVDVDAAGLLIKDARKRLSAGGDGEITLSRACMELGGDIRELHNRFAAEIDPRRYLKPDSRVVELIRNLGEWYALYIYTNNNRSLSRAVMEAIGVAGLFRRVFTVEDTWRPKPDQGTLERVLAEIGAMPEECLFVGDRYDVDLRLPADMGCAVYLATTPDELLALAKLTYGESR